MRKQTSNLKKLTAIYLAFRYFFSLIKKSKYKKILIKMDNIVVMYNINRKLGAMSLYHMMKIIREKLLAISKK
jgi:hypothetical protein